MCDWCKYWLRTQEVTCHYQHQWLPSSLTNVSASLNELTHLPLCRIYASVNWVSISSDNGLSPDRRQAIIWTNAGILLIRIKNTNFSFMKMCFTMLSGKWRPFCPGEDGLRPKSSWSCMADSIFKYISLKENSISINFSFLSHNKLGFGFANGLAPNKQWVNTGTIGSEDNKPFICWARGQSNSTHWSLKRTTFSRQHFQMQFLELKLLYFNQNLTDFFHRGTINNK